MRTLPILILVSFLVVSCNGSNKKSGGANPVEHKNQGPLKPTPRPDVVNNTDSEITVDPNDNNVYFVNPTKSDTMTIEKIRPMGANLGFCREFESIISMLNLKQKLLDEVKVTGNQIKDQKSQKERLEERLARERFQFSSDEIRAVENKIRTLMVSIETLQSSMVRAERRATGLQGTIDSVDKNLNIEGATALLVFESRWDTNINKLSLDNPHLTFKKAKTSGPVKLTLKARGLENLSAEKMILDLKSIFNMDDSLNAESQLESYVGQVRLTLYGACPITKPEIFNFQSDKIEIEVTYE